MTARNRALLVFSLVVAACAGGDDTTGTSATTTILPIPTVTAPDTSASPVTTSPQPATTSSTGPSSSSVPSSGTEVSGLAARVPDHVRYGPDGLVAVREGVEAVLVEGAVLWAGSDGAGGIVYSSDGQVWWSRADDPAPMTVEVAGASRLVGGRLLSTDSTGVPCEDGAGLAPMVLRDLPTGEQWQLGCSGGSGDGWGIISDAGGDRYVLETGMDLANYTTMTDLSIFGSDRTLLDLPGNPYPSYEVCRVQREGDPSSSCEVHGRLSPDGRTLATWHRPDFAIVVDAMDMPTAVVADEQAWLDRLDTLPAEVAVHELDSGAELYRTQLSARTRFVDFDGRFLVIAPCRAFEAGSSCKHEKSSTIIDITGRRPPITLPGPLALLRPSGSGSIAFVDPVVLQPGDTGPWVTLLQQHLNRHGLAVEVDGIYGPGTGTAVRSLQTIQGLTADGIVGPVTWTAVTGTRTGTGTGTGSAVAILRPDGLSTVDFGTPADQTTTALTDILGPFDRNEAVDPDSMECVEGSGWRDCLDVVENASILTWTKWGLSVLVTDHGGWDGATPRAVASHFGSWRAILPSAGGALESADGLHPGMTVGELRGIDPDVEFGYGEGIISGVYIEQPNGDYWGELDWDPASPANTWSELVRAVQVALNAGGAGLVVDGDWGPRSQHAWEVFFEENDLGPAPPTMWLTREVSDALDLPPDSFVVGSLAASCIEAGADDVC